MEDLQKDQAIYQAMLEIADNAFSEVMKTNKGLQSQIKEYGGFISLTDICKCNHDFSKNFFIALREDIGDEIRNVTVDTFECSFPVCQVFDLLKYWKSLAKIKGEQVFIFEEKVENEFAGSVEVTIENSNNAKLIVKHLAKDVLRPIMNYVVAEINANTQSIDFVASDGHTLAVISNKPNLVFERDSSCDTIFQAMFTADDWKRICDYAKKNKGHVLFDIYHHKDYECFDTFLVRLGDVTLRSSVPEGRYPNWKSVIPSPDSLTHRFNIIPEECKAAQDWIYKLKADSHRHVNVSFYRGSDLVYFDYDDYDFSKTMTATFHLTRPSDVTMGVAYSLRSMPTIKFTGFNIESEDRATIVNCEESDIMLVMPVLDSDGYVRDVESREVLEEVEETAMVVEMAAA